MALAYITKEEMMEEELMGMGKALVVKEVVKEMILRTGSRREEQLYTQGPGLTLEAGED